ncbi:MAG TPA: hypothetical protein VGT60_12795 [Candidatus Limnocylindria bacterium]|nr:hypothetical protein [Candidatus Limnocylindria bacterium]
MAIRNIDEGPGRPPGPMAVRSELPSHRPAEIRAVLRGLPPATGYTVTVKALRYRSRPHLVAFTFWDSAEMLIQVPEPFRPFREMVDLGSRGYPLVSFRTRRDVIRFLYLHEFCHWWLYLTHGWGTSAEVLCDTYAFDNFRRRLGVAPPAWCRPRERLLRTQPTRAARLR